MRFSVQGLGLWVQGVGFRFDAFRAHCTFDFYRVYMVCALGLGFRIQPSLFNPIQPV